MSFIFMIYHETYILKGPWDQAKFEKMLAKWIVTTDQPFYTVDKPKFCGLLTYMHHLSLNLKIPHHDTVKARIMKMGDEVVEATKCMFQVHK